MHNIVGVNRLECKQNLGKPLECKVTKNNVKFKKVLHRASPWYHWSKPKKCKNVNFTPFFVAKKKV